MNVRFPTFAKDTLEEKKISERGNMGEQKLIAALGLERVLTNLPIYLVGLQEKLDPIYIIE